MLPGEEDPARQIGRREFEFIGSCQRKEGYLHDGGHKSESGVRGKKSRNSVNVCSLIDDRGAKTSIATIGVK